MWRGRRRETPHLWVLCTHLITFVICFPPYSRAARLFVASLTRTPSVMFCSSTQTAWTFSCHLLAADSFASAHPHRQRKFVTGVSAAISTYMFNRAVATSFTLLAARCCCSASVILTAICGICKVVRLNNILHYHLPWQLSCSLALVLILQRCLRVR